MSLVKVNGVEEDIRIDSIIQFLLNGQFPGRRIVLTDPDDATGRTRNVYEDLDQETPQSIRRALVTLYPERAKAAANGDDDSGMEVCTHAHAVNDMVLMIEKFGYVVSEIERDL